MIKLLELFGGIGACSRALDHLGIEYEIADYVEIDKYAVQSYNAIHGTHFEPQDVTKWDKQLDVDLIMHGSPCQDFSIAGKNMGGNEGSGTRSSLMYETIRIVSNLKPKYVLWENVKNILSEKHIYNFHMYLDKMDELGYRNYYKVLNAKDYGIPQNRERVFTVSIRKDIKEEFVMPEPFPLDKRLKDLLEDEVDEKYYLSDELLNYFLRNNKVQEFKGNNFSFDYSDGDVVANSITPKNGQRMTDNYVSVKQIGNLTRNANRENPNRGRLYDQNGLSPTLGTMEGGNLQPFIFSNKLNNRVDIPQMVTVRKYEVDKDGLIKVLREHKTAKKLSNKDIAEQLKVPLTQAEHWFRNDKYFAIPEPEIWESLKELLGITTMQFDKAIMTFEKREGTYDQGNRVYHEEGMSPTITSQIESQRIMTTEQMTDGLEFVRKKYKKFIDEKGYIPEMFNPYNGTEITNIAPTLTTQCSSVTKNSTVLLGGIGEKKSNNGTQFYQQDRVYSADGVAMAHPANLPDGSYKYAIDEQNKLVRDDGTVGTITTDGSSPKHNNRVSNGLRIRKLTPRECWRLMGFDDQAFDQAEKVCSNSQLYKQAGNSIVVDVLEKILTNLLINPQKLEKEQMSIFDFIERDKL